MLPRRMSTDRTRLLVRTTVLDARVLAFADELAAASGHPVAFVVDERAGPVAAEGRQIVGLSDPACEALGLYCPHDYAWKCGDYALYLARRRFPDAERFWMIEYDVRFRGGDLAEFFGFFDAVDSVDFIAPHLAPAGPEWFWTATARSRDARPWRCLFPVTRWSARAVDAASRKRARHSRNPFRRLVWPNDEAFVATTLVNGGFECRDFNGFGRTVYSAQSFSFDTPIDGDAFAPAGDHLQMFHPVLYGEAYARKMARLLEAERSWPGFDRRRRIALRINAISRW